MKRAAPDESRERKRTKVIFEKELNFFEWDAEAPEILETLRKELPRARHLRIRTQLSEIEVKWDVDEVLGEQHQNHVIIRNVDPFTNHARRATPFGHCDRCSDGY